MSAVPSEVVPGERGVAVVARMKSLGARIHQSFAIVVLGLVGGGFLFWYYHGLAARESAPREAAEQAAQQKASGEMRLPPLVKPEPRRVVLEEQDVAPVEDVDAVGAALPMYEDWGSLGGGNSVAPATPVSYGAAVASAEDLALKRKLEAPVLLRPSLAELGGEGLGEAGGVAGSRAGGPATALAASLVPTATPGALATVLSTRRFLVPKGMFIDCTLETAIDSTLPGMTTCVTASDVFGADGRVVLIERGTKLVGETRSEVRAGQRRVFVLWNEARTPAGVVASLASPGTDSLGRAGLTGEVDTHFWQRFGAAILLSVLDAVTIALVNAQQDGDSTVVLSPSGSQEVMAEVIKSTVDIPPTIRVAQGARIQVFVARDVDFSGVYRLRTRNDGQPAQ